MPSCPPSNIFKHFGIFAGVEINVDMFKQSIVFKVLSIFNLSTDMLPRHIDIIWAFAGSVRREHMRRCADRDLPCISALHDVNPFEPSRPQLNPFKLST